MVFLEMVIITVNMVIITVKTYMVIITVNMVIITIKMVIITIFMRLWKNNLHKNGYQNCMEMVGHFVPFLNGYDNHIIMQLP